MQYQISEEIKDFVHTKTEEALQLAEKDHDLWMYQNEKEEAKRLQGVRKPRKDAEMAWPDWEEARNMEESEWRLKPEGEAEVPEIIIVVGCGGSPCFAVTKSAAEKTLSCWQLASVKVV